MLVDVAGVAPRRGRRGRWQLFVSASQLPRLLQGFPASGSPSAGSRTARGCQTSPQVRLQTPLRTSPRPRCLALPRTHRFAPIDNDEVSKKCVNPFLDVPSPLALSSRSRGGSLRGEGGGPAVGCFRCRLSGEVRVPASSAPHPVPPPRPSAPGDDRARDGNSDARRGNAVSEPTRRSRDGMTRVHQGRPPGRVYNITVMTIESSI